MTIAVERLPECKARLDIEIPAGTVNGERAKIVQAFAGQAKVPGFRPGKTPLSVIEKRYGKEIEEELRSRLLQQALGEASEKENLEILGIAQVEKEFFNPDGAFSLSAEVVTAPDIELSEYKDIEVKVPKIEIDDEQIDNVLERMRQNFAEFIDIEDRALAAGDIAVISWKASRDGKPLAETVEVDVAQLAESEEYWVKLPADDDEEESFLPGFTPQLVGMETGETREVDVTIPEEFQPEELSGKDVRFTVTLKTIKDQELPEIDDELAAKIQPESDLESLREGIQENLQQEQENMRQELITNQILGVISGELDIDLPEHLVFNETQRQVNEIVVQSYQRGAGDEEIKEHQEEIVESAQGRAQANLKTNFILEEIARKEELTVSNDELSRHVALMAAQSGRPLKKVVNQLKQSDGFGAIRHDLLIGKVLEFLRSNASVSEVEPEEAEAPSQSEES